MTSERLDERWEARIDQVAAGARYPETPALGNSVMASVRAEGRVARPALGVAPRFAVAAVLALLVLVASLAVPSTRTAIGEFFGLVEGEHHAGRQLILDRMFAWLVE